MSADTEDEADRLEGTPHPRQARRLIGHAAVERDLLDAYRANKLPHAIIFGGPAGIGKATLAWRLARFILANPDPNAPAVRDARDFAVVPDSKVASQIASLSHPDVSLLRREVNDKTKRFYTEIRADDVRKTIQLFQRAASAGGYRIGIVDSAEDLNRSSANALLKLIEEPPPKSLFLLVAHRPGLILPTIRSRSRFIRLGALTPSEVDAVVGSLGPPWSEQTHDDRAKAAAQAHGSVHGALRLLGGSKGIELDALVQRLLRNLPNVDWTQVHRLADQIAGRDGEAGFDIAMTAIYDWLDQAVHDGAAGQGPRRLAPYAEAWDKVAANARETEALNLDKRPLILTIFSDLAAAVRAAA
ncbi:DNA polymerase III subunit delta' [Beijerinckia sp. L45]|uniref:DNA polymerase III subunit delta' n=1 Tax=Beijerinckia sp. L45 TaxID=1641855 RepID=UPI00131A6742|nr:DNA polymerase III subunit delta' [Beijerinckia sp. L45]